jgi:hypothetical protein
MGQAKRPQNRGVISKQFKIIIKEAKVVKERNIKSDVKEEKEIKINSEK